MPIETLTAPERETIINADDQTNVVRIWTAQRAVITSLRRKHESFHEIGSGRHGSTEWAEFSIPISDVNWGSLAKRKGTPRPNAGASLRDRSLTVSTEQEKAA